jgi:rubrerythrin
MDNESKRMIDGIRTAIQMEADGHNFYELAANGTRDAMGKQVFSTLAGEELTHMNFLKDQYLALTETGKVSATVKLGPRADLSGANPIFSPDAAKKIGFGQIEMSALSIGIMLELSSIDFYKKHAAEDPDPAVKDFYNVLADWEQGHYEALLRQQNDLKEEYWSKGGFAPF